MSLPHPVADVLTQHVTLEVESIDRSYLAMDQRAFTAIDKDSSSQLQTRDARSYVMTKSACARLGWLFSSEMVARRLDSEPDRARTVNNHDHR